MKVPPPPPDFPQPSSDRVVIWPVENLNSPKHRDRREYQIEQARTLWQDYEAARMVRERTLAPLLRTRHRNGVVLVMTLNQGHADLFANWAASCDVHSIEVRSWTVVFPLDPEAAALAEGLGFSVYFDGVSYGKHATAAAEAFGDAVFARLMFPKTAVVQDILNLGYWALFQDVDLIWRKDPFDYLTHPARRHLDAQFMYDGPNWIYAPLHANTGFFLLRNGEPSKTTWRLVCEHMDKILWARSQQEIVNQILVSRFFRGLNLDILREKDFANGHLFSELSVDALPPDPYVIHCSWTKNLEHKLKKLRFADLWYLDEPRRRRWCPPQMGRPD